MPPGRECTDWDCCDLWDGQTSKTALSYSQDSADQPSRHGFPGSSCSLMGRKGLAFLLPRANVMELFITCLTANRSMGSWKFSGWRAELNLDNLVQHCGLEIFIKFFLGGRGFCLFKFIQMCFSKVCFKPLLKIPQMWKGFTGPYYDDMFLLSRATCKIPTIRSWI